MEPILTVDLAAMPARLSVLSLGDDNTFKVISETEIDFTTSKKEANQAEQAEGQSEEQVVSEELQDEFTAKLSAAIENIDSSWTSSAIIYSPNSYHSFNIELPFSDDKNVSKVLSLETQDRVPFDLDEFVIDHRVLGQRADNQFDIHIALAKKAEISELLNKCQKAGLDPVAISTVSSLIEAKIKANPDTFAANLAVVSIYGSRVHLVFRINSDIKSDRSFEINELDANLISAEILRSIASIENRFNIKIHQVWLESVEYPGNSTLESENEVIKDFIKKLSSNLADNQLILEQNDKLAGVELRNLYANICLKGMAAKLLVNFRTGQFSQTMKWDALWAVFKNAVPYLLMLVFVFLVVLIATYFARENEISRISQELISKVQPLFSETKLVPNQVVRTIQQANDNIEKQLKDLGSPSKFSPMEVLLEVSKDLPTVKDTTITSVSLRGAQLMISGSTNTYENVDKLERVFQAKRTLYCRTLKQVSGTTVRQFTFTISLCD